MTKGSSTFGTNGKMKFSFSSFLVYELDISSNLSKEGDKLTNLNFLVFVTRRCYNTALLPFPQNLEQGHFTTRICCKKVENRTKMYT